MMQRKYFQPIFLFFALLLTAFNVTAEDTGTAERARVGAVFLDAFQRGNYTEAAKHCDPKMAKLMRAFAKQAGAKPAPSDPAISSWSGASYVSEQASGKRGWVLRFEQKERDEHRYTVYLERHGNTYRIHDYREGNDR